MQEDPIVIVSSARTPMGGMLGVYSDVECATLGATAIKAAVARAGIKSEDVDEVIMGNVLSAGQGQAPARQAALGADLPLSTSATTINKMCGSGLKAVMFANDLLRLGENKVMVAGGMENMTRAPYLLPKARQGFRLGHGDIKDHMFLDGLEDAYDRGRLMGTFAEETATRYSFTREQQDEFAITSLQRAKKAIESGAFTNEITPVTYQTRKGDITVDTDEQPLKAKIDKIPTLKPAFAKDGTVTAANSSSISDGAAAVTMMRLSEAEKRGLTPLARIVGHASHSRQPSEFTIAPVHAIQALFEKTGWSSQEVELFEVNEAFAVVTMAAIHDLKLDPSKVNVHGGACALGHPIGASGARILVTLIQALRTHKLNKGVASLCIGGGEAVALAVELIH
ncbi:MAG: acetyl-CoA C-acyltransferase [Pseudomonadota bacterium]